MTSHEQGFLQTIVENPFDDTPRLIYADWLEEHGNEPRAEFIRLQIEEADQRAGKYPASEANDRRQDFLEKRIHELEVKHGGDWVVAHPGWFPNYHPINKWKFERGFIGEICLPEWSFLRNAKGLFAGNPITKVILTDRHPYRVGGKFYLSNYLDAHGTLQSSSERINYDPRIFQRFWLLDSEIRPVGKGEFTVRWDGSSHWDVAPTNRPHQAWIEFSSLSDALKLVSDGCVLYGRTVAGLPSLPKVTYDR